MTIQERLRDLIGPHSGTYGMGDLKAVQPLLDCQKNHSFVGTVFLLRSVKRTAGPAPRPFSVCFSGWVVRWYNALYPIGNDLVLYSAPIVDTWKRSGVVVQHPESRAGGSERGQVRRAESWLTSFVKEFGGSERTGY